MYPSLAMPLSQQRGGTVHRVWETSALTKNTVKISKDKRNAACASAPHARLVKPIQPGRLNCTSPCMLEHFGIHDYSSSRLLAQQSTTSDRKRGLDGGFRIFFTSQREGSAYLKK